MSTQLPGLSGETRVLAIMGDPIAQVKSPAGVTATLNEKGINAVLVPIHVAPADLAALVQGMSLAKNFDGISMTVPHKFAAHGLCASATERADFLGACNIMRRNPDGSWHGDMCDGEGFVAAARAAGCKPEGKRALLVGAGGAGSAIALALLDAGVSELAVHDGDTARRDALVARLRSLHGDKVLAGSDDPSGFGVVVNATPSGMRDGDPLPVQAGKFTADMFVGDVITVPAVTPMLQAARDKGCLTQTGGGMFAAVRDRMIDFLLETGPLAR
ncbi:shikimate dehydrogenase family protein [Thauera sp. SDU_THAU2]|uniref:shikimate dehydrogenase family protein n=1 Tax=Thauera sp. SDU_THAU2 TaxID=3136633 RepID=UPI00311D7689